LCRQVEAGYTDHVADAEKQAIVQDYFAFCADGDALVGHAKDALVEQSETTSFSIAGTTPVPPLDA
jgi:hypothetical protein